MSALALLDSRASTPRRRDTCLAENLPVAPRRPSSFRQSNLIPVSGSGRRLEVKIASCPEEWEEAFRLVTKSYRARGYEPPSCKPIRFTAYQALPESVTFVAKHATQIVATLSLVPDNHVLGLPMETIYGGEIENLRRQGRRLVEVTSLANRLLRLGEFIPLFLTLMKVMAQYAVLQGADTWVIAVNPRHRLFYTQIMGFVPLGPQRPYPPVQHQVAEAYMATKDLLRAHNPEMFDTLFADRLPPEKLASRPMPPEVARAFSLQSMHTDETALQRLVQHARRFGGSRRW